MVIDGNHGFDPARMNFGGAIAALKMGFRVSRRGWNGQGMWLSYSPGSPSLPAESFWSPHNRAYAESNGGFAVVRPSMTLKTADGSIMMGWSPSGSDALAEDWFVYED